MTTERKIRGRGRGEDDGRYDGDAGKFEQIPYEDDNTLYLSRDDAQRSVEGWVIVVAGIHDETQDDDIYNEFADFGEIKNLHMLA